MAAPRYLLGRSEGSALDGLWQRGAGYANGSEKELVRSLPASRWGQGGWWDGVVRPDNPSLGESCCWGECLNIRHY